MKKSSYGIAWFVLIFFLRDVQGNRQMVHLLPIRHRHPSKKERRRLMPRLLSIRQR